MTNRRYVLASRPTGLVSRENFELTEEAITSPGDGEFLVKLEYISLDPAMRGWMNDVRSYVPPVQVGEVMRALGAGTVQSSNHGGFKEGDSVLGVFGVQECATSDGAGVITVDPSFVPLPTYLGALGMPGMTAYFGLLDVGDVKGGETVVVSGAAGAVGSVAGQIAKIKGCSVVGIAGGPEKCAWITEDLGFDAAIDYKSDDVRAALKQHCPKGVDVYFDNVGGDILDIVLGRLARHARIVICGAISQYNNEGGMKGPSNYMSLLVNRARMEGFVVFDYADRYAHAGLEMAGWIAEGKLKTREDIVDGLENFPEALLRLFSGANIGKLVLKV